MQFNLCLLGLKFRVRPSVNETNAGESHEPKSKVEQLESKISMHHIFHAPQVLTVR